MILKKVLCLRMFSLILCILSVLPTDLVPVKKVAWKFVNISGLKNSDINVLLMANKVKIMFHCILKNVGCSNSLHFCHFGLLCL